MKLTDILLSSIIHTLCFTKYINIPYSRRACSKLWVTFIYINLEQFPTFDFNDLDAFGGYKLLFYRPFLNSGLSDFFFFSELCLCYTSGQNTKCDAVFFSITSYQEA